MRRSRSRERFFQEQGQREKAAAHAQAYSMGDVKVGLIVGEYPPRNYARERAEGVKK